MKNHEVLKSFPKEHLCSEVENQGEDNHSYDLQGNKAKPYTSLKVKDYFVAGSQLSVSDSLFSCELNDSLPHSDIVFVESVHILVDPIDDRIDSSSKINLCPPSVDTCVLKIVHYQVILVLIN